jgi:hypothetical protein
MPARSTAEMCTNTSFPPSVGWMNPNPFFLRIEKLHDTLSHIWPPLKTPIGAFGYTTIA